MAGQFILSLDCEGKWGVADHLTKEHHNGLTDQALEKSYRAIMNILDRHSISATFAIVGCFGLDMQSLLDLPRDEISTRLPYTKDAFDDIAEGSGEGWSGSWIYDMIDDRHEIGLHGITHTPFDLMDENAARFELSLLPIQSGQTFIFPRNKVEHIPILHEHRISGYRTAKAGSAIKRLADEFNIVARSEAHPTIKEPQPIPAGHFVNWLSGARRLVPLEITRLRCRNMIDHAIRTDGIVHFWTHPENMATAPDTLKVLDIICSEVNKAQEKGDLSVVTQKQYCEGLARSGS